MARKATEFVQFKLRIRESLRRKIERAAEKQAHSANAEAVERIEKTFAYEESREANREVFKATVDKINEKLEQLALDKEKFKAAFRDTSIVNMMVGDQPESAKLLYRVASELGKVPGWAQTPETKKALADRIHYLILNAAFPPNELPWEPSE